MTFVKSTSPKKIATIYPPIIPNRNGMIFKKPFAFVLIKAVMRNVTTATTIAFQSPSFTNPAFVTALLASPRPITIIIGPMTIGGKSRLIQFVPKNLTKIATTTYNSPTNTTPVWAASGFPSICAIANCMAVRKAKEDPKYTGTLNCVATI